jgi:hypothetical protein
MVQSITEVAIPRLYATSQKAGRHFRSINRIRSG